MPALTEKEILLAQNGRKVLEEKDLAADSGEADLILRKENETVIALPMTAVRLLNEALGFISEGREVHISAVDKELSTQKAAEFLNVSRPFLIKLLESKKMPYRRVGNHRRVLLSDLDDYKTRIDKNRLKVLAELAAQAQELEMGY